MRGRLSIILYACVLAASACGDTGTESVDRTGRPTPVTSEAEIQQLRGSGDDDESSPPDSMAGRPEEALTVLVEADIPYTSEFALDVYYPDAPGPWPGAVVFHGGEVPKSSVRSYASAVAEQGVVVFVPEYSSTPAQVSEVLHLGGEDAVCAMRFARTHASDFDGSGNRIVTAGASYGANVAALMVLASDQFEGDCLVNSEVSAAADGLLGLDGMYDFTTLPRVLGFYDYYTVEEMQRASAITYVEQNEPRRETVFELFTGREPASQEQAELFSDSLTAAGYKVLLVPQPDQPHSAYGGEAPGIAEALADLAFGQ